jgi:hypothetical protein
MESGTPATDVGAWAHRILSKLGLYDIAPPDIVKGKIFSII